jgi:hypothetical protein
LVSSKLSNIEPVRVWMRVARAAPPWLPSRAPSTVMVLRDEATPRMFMAL